MLTYLYDMEDMPLHYLALLHYCNYQLGMVIIRHRRFQFALTHNNHLLSMEDI